MFEKIYANDSRHNEFNFYNSTIFSQQNKVFRKNCCKKAAIKKEQLKSGREKNANP